MAIGREKGWLKGSEISESSPERSENGVEGGFRRAWDRGGGRARVGALSSRVDLSGLAGLEETLTLSLAGEGNGAKSGALMGVECVYGKVPGALRSSKEI